MAPNVGIDIVDVERFALALRRQPRLLERLFTAGERRDARERPERLAARFAAKEAALKTLGVGLGAAPWHAIEVTKEPSGAPHLVLHGAAQELARAAGLTDFALSLTHTSISAAAVVYGWGEAPHGG